MQEKKLDGNTYCRLLRGGYRKLREHAAEINGLNVFPIPDGDTGDNLCATVRGGVQAVRGAEDLPLWEAAERVSRGMLLGARGNSGVILSRMFAGIAEGFKGLKEAGPREFASAAEEGVRCAYASVLHPVEGTMLTVMNEATGFAAGRVREESTLEEFIRDFIREAEVSLSRTPELLQVLKEAGVIDSGGAGVLCLARGALEALRGGTGEDGAEEEAAAAAEGPDLSRFDENSVLEFGYCTECLLQLTRAKTDVEAFSLDELRAWLQTVGDSIAAFQTGTVVKVHVHTERPGRVLEYLQQFGEFLTLKIENMTIQHSSAEEKKREPVFRKNPVRKPFGVVAVAEGEGMIRTFREMGADAVIDSGAGNPSVALFLEAVRAVNADAVFVLPDNCNFRLAAQEAAKLTEDSRVLVLPSGDMGEGYAALSALDCTGEAEQIADVMTGEMKNSVSGMVAKASRTAEFSGLEIKKDDFIGFSRKTVLATAGDRVRTALALVERLGLAEREFAVVFYGKAVREGERKAFSDALKAQYPHVELYEVEGGQELYDFIVVLQ